MDVSNPTVKPSIVNASDGEKLAVISVVASVARTNQWESKEKWRVKEVDAIAWKVDVVRNTVSVFREGENATKVAIAEAVWIRNDQWKRTIKVRDRIDGNRLKDRLNFESGFKKRKYLLMCVFMSKKLSDNRWMYFSHPIICSKEIFKVSKDIFKVKKICGNCSPQKNLNLT